MAHPVARLPPTSTHRLPLLSPPLRSTQRRLHLLCVLRAALCVDDDTRRRRTCGPHGAARSPPRPARISDAHASCRSSDEGPSCFDTPVLRLPLSCSVLEPTSRFFFLPLADSMALLTSAGSAGEKAFISFAAGASACREGGRRTSPLSEAQAQGDRACGTASSHACHSKGRVTSSNLYPPTFTLLFSSSLPSAMVPQFAAAHPRQSPNLKGALAHAQQTGRPLQGLFAGIDSLQCIKLAADVGYDVILLDVEHTCFTGDSMVSHVQAINFHSRGKSMPSVSPPLVSLPVQQLTCSLSQHGPHPQHPQRAALVGSRRWGRRQSVTPHLLSAFSPTTLTLFSSILLSHAASHRDVRSGEGARRQVPVRSLLQSSSGRHSRRLIRRASSRLQLPSHGSPLWTSSRLAPPLPHRVGRGRDPPRSDQRERSVSLSMPDVAPLLTLHSILSRSHRPDRERARVRERRGDPLCPWRGWLCVLSLPSALLSSVR